MRRWCQSKLPPGPATLYSTMAHSCDGPETMLSGLSDRAFFRPFRFFWLVVEARHQVVQPEHDPSRAEEGQDDRRHEENGVPLPPLSGASVVGVAGVAGVEGDPGHAGHVGHPGQAGTEAGANQRDPIPAETNTAILLAIEPTDGIQ